MTRVPRIPSREQSRYRFLSSLSYLFRRRRTSAVRESDDRAATGLRHHQPEANDPQARGAQPGSRTTPSRRTCRRRCWAHSSRMICAGQRWRKARVAQQITRGRATRWRSCSPSGDGIRRLAGISGGIVILEAHPGQEHKARRPSTKRSAGSPGGGAAVDPGMTGRLKSRTATLHCQSPFARSAAMVAAPVPDQTRRASGPLDEPAAMRGLTVGYAKRC
jgi:hypothetical protein